MIVGDFNRDQRLCENVAKVDPLIQNFTQRSQYSTHIHGRLLDLPCIGYFRSQAVSSLPSPYSDHFTWLEPIIVLNLNISFNLCARLGFNVIWFVKCMKIRKLKIEIISI